MFHRFGMGRLFKWVGAGRQMEKKLWKLGCHKVMEAFAMGRWCVQNENRAWKGLNRLFIDHWFSHRLLKFAHTPSLILHTFRKAFSQSWVCEIFAPLAK